MDCEVKMGRRPAESKVPTYHVNVVLPEPLFFWFREYAGQRGMSGMLRELVAEKYESVKDEESR